MKRKIRSIKLIALLTILGCWVTLVWANSTGPPPSNTGAPGEGNCADCHATNPVNTGGGSVSLAGLPQNYTPGTRYNLTVTVAKSDRARWGFQITAIHDDGSAAGTFMVTDTTNTRQLTNSVGGKQRVYIEQTTTGTQRGVQASVNYKLDWVAPSADEGKITFYLAGNAANGDGTLVGDNIYTTSVAISAVAAPVTPTISNLNPSRGGDTGGTTVLITGSNYKSGATASFDGLAANVTFVDNRTLRVVTPPHAPGVVDVVVTNPDSQTVRARGAFTYEQAQPINPVLVTISPASGPAEGGTMVTASGSEFATGAKLFFGTREATISSLSLTQIVALTPPNDAGLTDVTVMNPSGQVSVLKGAFNYTGSAPTPFVKLVAPNGGEVLGAGSQLSINWQLFSSMSAVQKLELSTDSGQSFATLISDNLPASQTSFSFNLPAGLITNTARVRISVTDNGTVLTDTSDQDFKIIAVPTITNISPKVGTSIKLKISGTLFQSGAVVEVNGSPVTTTVKSATSIIAKKISRSLAGTPIKVRVRNPDGGVSMEQTITP